MNGRLLCYVRGFTQLPQKRKAATYFEGPGGHGRPLLAGSYVTQRVRLAYSKPGTSTGRSKLESEMTKKICESCPWKQRTLKRMKTEVKLLLTLHMIATYDCVEVLQLSQPIRVMSSVVLVSSPIIMKTCLYKSYPLKPHFYIVKLGFTGVYIIFLISA